MNKSLVYKTFEGRVDDAIDEVFDKRGSELVQVHAVQRSSAQIKSAKRKIKQAMKLEHIEEFLCDAFKLIHDQLQNVAPSEDFSRVYLEFTNCRSSMEDYYKGLLEEEQIEANPTFQEILGLSDETLLCCYRLGLKLFDEQHYQDAYNVFTLLCLLCPRVPSYFIAAAICEKGLNDYNAALKTLTRAKKVHPSVPSLYIHCAHCYIKLDEPLRAKTELEQAEKLLSEDADILMWNSTLEELKSQTCIEE